VTRWLLVCVLQVLVLEQQPTLRQHPSDADCTEVSVGLQPRARVGVSFCERGVRYTELGAVWDGASLVRMQCARLALCGALEWATSCVRVLLPCGDTRRDASVLLLAMRRVCWSAYAGEVCDAGEVVCACCECAEARFLCHAC
jgi:hypothetical protein